MIKFVQIEDNIFFANNVSQIITKIMMRKKDAYEIKHFKDYCPELKKLICEKEEQKIYILDIELPKKSGIDIAREIRNKGDYKSIIIFLTAHYELSMQVLENNLMILCFITKFNNFEEKLVNSINKSLNIVGKNKCLILEESNVLYRFNFEEIMYIIKDTVERKTIIRTKKNEFKLNVNISDLSQKLDDRFISTHRSCIANKHYVKKMDYKQGKIEFINGDYLYMISRSGKKRLKNDVDVFS